MKAGGDLEEGRVGVTSNEGCPEGRELILLGSVGVARGQWQQVR